MRQMLFSTGRSMGKTESMRKTLRGEFDLLGNLLSSGAIPPEDYDRKARFILQAVDKLDRPWAYAGQVDFNYSGPVTYQTEFGAFIVDEMWPDGVVGMITQAVPYGPSPFEKYKEWFGVSDYEKLVMGQWSDDPVDSTENTGSPLTKDAFEQTISNITKEKWIRVKADRDEDRRVTSALKWAMDEQERLAFMGPSGVNAAERLWQEYNGIVLCECDNPDCQVEIDLTHDEYW